MEEKNIYVLIRYQMAGHTEEDDPIWEPSKPIVALECIDETRAAIKDLNSLTYSEATWFQAFEIPLLPKDLDAAIFDEIINRRVKETDRWK